MKLMKADYIVPLDFFAKHFAKMIKKPPNDGGGLFRVSLDFVGFVDSS
jgi:hypothetical protein